MSKFGSDAFIEETIRTLKQQLIEVQQARERAEAQVESGYKSFCGMEHEWDAEHKTRVKYQDIVYAACNEVDRIIGRKAPGVGVVITELTGSIARIGTERDTLRGLLREVLAYAESDDGIVVYDVWPDLRERITAALKEVECDTKRRTKWGRKPNESKNNQP